MQDDDFEMFKIVVIGDSSIGKSNIALRFIKGDFKDSTKATIGVEFMHKMMTVNGTKVKVTLWDTAGQEVYRALSKVYYKGALGVILVYDVTNQKSYLNVQEWYKLAKDNLNEKEVVMIVLGNKIDLVNEKVVDSSKALEDYKQKLGIECFEVSALTGQGIQESIMYLIEQIYAKNVLKQESIPQQQLNTMQQSAQAPMQKSAMMRASAMRASSRPQIIIKPITQQILQAPQLQASAIVIRDPKGGLSKKDKKKCAC